MNNKPPGLEKQVTTLHVWRLAWPSIIGNLMLTSVGIAHIKIVANHGTDAVAAVTSGHRVYFLLQAVLMGLSAAATAIIARHWGAGKVDAAARAIRSALRLSLAIALIAGIGFIAGAEPIVNSFGLEPGPSQLAIRFVQVMAIFSMAYAVSLILSTAMRAIGDPRTAMNYSIYSAVLNIALCIVLVDGYLGLPTMGSTGAALAGGLAPLLLYSLLIFRWINGQLSIPYTRSSDKDDDRALIKLATPAAIEQIVIHLGLITFMALVAYYGTAAFAAYGLGISLLSAILVIGFGFSIAGATLTGQYLGAHNSEQAWRSAVRTLKLSVLTLLVLGAALFFSAQSLSQFMVEDPEVIRYSVSFLKVIAIILPLIAIEMSIGGVLRGAGDTRFPLLVTLAGLIVRLILGVLVVYTNMPITWLFATLAADYLLKILLLCQRFLRRNWLR